VKRRQLLRLSSLALTVPLGGCASTGETEEESEFKLTTTDEIPVEKRKSEFTRSYPGQEPFAEVVLGEKPKTSDNLYGVEIYNDHEDPVEISLTVNRESNERTLVFEGEGTISNNEYVVIAISNPATYINKLETSDKNTDLQKTFDVPQSAWEAGQTDEKSTSPEHNVHIQKNEIEVRFVGEER
jgi:hypothetical protein